MVKHQWLRSCEHTARGYYSEEVQRQFLSFYQETICPQLGARPVATSIKSGMGRDGNPFESSFEPKGLTKSQAVRFVVDVGQLRPEDQRSPLSIERSQTVIDALAEQMPGLMILGTVPLLSGLSIPLCPRPNSEP